MINTILNALNIHVSSFDSYKEERNERKRLRKKIRCQTKRIKVLEDIALGIKQKDLNVLYENVNSVKQIIDKFTAERNIFVS